ncbi:MAG: LUD domain-containing protein [Planctomycetota bacterium]
MTDGMAQAAGHDSLLERIGRALEEEEREGSPHPGVVRGGERPALGWEDFREALEEARGECEPPLQRGELRRAIARITAADCPRKEDLGHAHGAAALLEREPAPADARLLDGLPWMVASGRAAVARTASVVVTSEEAPVRLHLLLPERLLLLVPARGLFDDLPDLYAALDPGSLAGGYLTLISGPSKTADIEQTLITGAHGPRRLVVLPYEE